MKKTVILASVGTLWMLASAGFAHTHAFPRPCVMSFSGSVPLVSQSHCGYGSYNYTDKVINYTRDDTLTVYVQTPGGSYQVPLGPHSTFAYPDDATYQYEIRTQDGAAIYDKDTGGIFSGSQGYYNIPASSRWVFDHRVIGDPNSGDVAQDQGK